MSSIFTKIINKEVPSHIVAETEDYIAFMDTNPNCIGHTLCVPKQEVDDLFHLDEKTYHGLMEFTHQISNAIKKAMDCKRVGMAVIGLEVPHAHIHLLPINSMDDFSFDKDRKVPQSDQELQAVMLKIQEKI